MELVPSFIARRPHVAEHDFTGIVVDANGTELANGQPVYGFVPVRAYHIAPLHDSDQWLRNARATQR